jgi:hypothetical protein
VWDDTDGCRLSPLANGTVCDGSDPCAARVCIAGSCGPPAGDARHLDVRRLLVKPSDTGLRVRARAVFAGGTGIDLGASSVAAELRRPDGTTLHRVEVPPDALRTNRRGTSARYVRQRNAELPSAEGLERLKIKLRRDRIAVSMYMTVPDATEVPEGLTWVLQLGASCARDVALACTRTGTSLFCESVAGGA